jgi:hypothetical protein
VNFCDGTGLDSSGSAEDSAYGYRGAWGPAPVLRHSLDQGGVTSIHLEVLATT